MDFDVVLPSGRIRARRWGGQDAPLLLCVPGLAANLCAFTAVAEELASAGHQVVAMDLRGTGRSEITPAGSYGMDGHARDVLGVAASLGATRFGLVGWSLGALIAMQVAVLEGSKLRSVTLLDHAGPTDAAALVPVRDGLARLDLAVADPQEYLDAVRSAGPIEPWSPFWDRYHTYELAERADGRWSPSTSRAAAEEDLRQRWPRDWRPYWRALTMPTTLVRAMQPIGGALVVPQHAVDALLAVNPGVRVVETQASNHWTCLEDPELIAAVSASQD
ncbi:MAG: alpha/beta hydrolase [Mycobacterium sp.]